MRGTGIADPSLAYPISLLVVIEVHDAQLLVFCVVLCLPYVPLTSGGFLFIVYVYLHLSLQPRLAVKGKSP
jgi:hypothetical protein